MKKKRLFLLLARRLGRCGGARALVLALELAQQRVAALGRTVERQLGRHLAIPYGLELLLDDGADRLELAEADTARFPRRLVQQQLLDGDLVTGVFPVKALLCGAFVSGAGDRHVAGALVPLGLPLRAREPGEKARPAPEFG